MDYETLKLVAVFLMSIVAGVLSGMAGMAGGVIMTPFLIWLGLTPQQTIATGKFASFGLGVGSLAAFRGRILKEKRSALIGIVALSLLIGVLSAALLQEVDNHILQIVMGVLMLFMVPVVWKEKAALKKRKTSNLRHIFGYVSLFSVLLMQGIMGGGVGMLLTVVFIIFFGATAIEANMLQKIAGLFLNVVIVLLLLHTGLILFDYGVVGLLGALIGGYLGSRMAIKKGNAFAKSLLMGFMTLSGIALILTA